ncbi:MAG: hypothetical protein GX030_07190 [Firmicutes bacterium]|nr:hypothetical protein [Bacillota bacterium]
MKRYLQAATIWVIIVPIAILNGVLRESVVVKLGAIALPLSGIILSLCIFGVAYLLIPKIGSCGKKEYLVFGVLWFLLTNLFDLGMILSDGGSLSDLFAAYNFLGGNLWIIVVLTTLLSPIAVARIRKLVD